MLQAFTVDIFIRVEWKCWIAVELWIKKTCVLYVPPRSSAVY